MIRSMVETVRACAGAFPTGTSVPIEDPTLSDPTMTGHVTSALFLFDTVHQ